MNDVYITEINIKKARHLKNISLKLNPNERKHLILTGKNGSGKTSLLLFLKYMLIMVQESKSSGGTTNIRGETTDQIIEDNELILRFTDNSNNDIKLLINYNDIIHDLFEQDKFILNMFEARR